MGKGDLPDIYSQARGLQAEGEGIYIWQILIAHVIALYYIRLCHLAA